MTRIYDLQAAAWDAECRRDLVELLGYFNDDAEFHPAGGTPARGHDAIRAMTEEFYNNYPSLEIDIISERGDGETTAAFEFRAHLVDNDGVKSTLDGVCLVSVADGAFTHVRYYEDAPVPA